MNKLLLTLLAVSLTACGPADPTSRARYNAQLQAQAETHDYHVVKLFTKDGCTVYRFRDNRDHYFTNCNGAVSETQSHKDGKNTYYYDETIPTAVN